MNLRQAAQQALEALEYTGMDVGKFNRVNAACAALRAALAEPEQEPVAFDVQKALRRAYQLGQKYWADADSESYSANKRADKHRQDFEVLCDKALAYTAPTPRKPLTEPELHAINPTWPAPGQEWGYEEVLAFVRAIERAHGIGEQHE